MKILRHFNVNLGLFALLLSCSNAAQPVAETPAAIVTPIGPKTIETTLQSVGLDGGAMDKSADPCSDFYSYACGNWNKTTEIPGDEPAWYRSFDEIQRRNEADLRKILEDAAKNTAADDATRKIGAFYGACMDEATAEAEGVKPIEPWLQRLRTWKDVKTLPNLVAELHGLGMAPLFRISAEQDFADATSVIAGMDQGGIGMPDRDDYFRDDEKSKKLRELYQTHIKAMLVLAGLKDKDAVLAATQVFQFETELAKVSKTRVERRDPKGLHNPLKRNEIDAVAAGFAWQTYFDGLKLGPAVPLNVTSKTFFAGMAKLTATAPIATLRNYLIWQVISSSSHMLTKAIYDESFRFEQAITGQPEQKQRWRRCLEATDEALGELLAQPYIAQRFGGESKGKADSMVRAITAAFVEAAGRLDWMDAKTRERAVKKSQQMAFLIGFPNKWRAYDFAVDAKTHAANMQQSRKAEVARVLAKIGKPLDRQEWSMSPPTVNAYYDPQKNHMVFPAGILQPPFFNAKAAVAVNLGGIGMVIGHELTHGFDDEGAQFDGDGNLKNWWEGATSTEFEKRTACVADQYDHFEVLPGLKVNGKLTLGENIADMGGLKLAFAAYRQLRKDAKEIQVADGLSEDQQFFLAHAQVWCGKARPDYVRQMVQTNPHSPPQFRVMGPLSNMREFADAFQCKAGSAMRPEKSCVVW